MSNFQSGSPNRPARQISLEELGEMTRATQESERTGSRMTDEFGQPLKEVQTVNLTQVDEYDPLKNAKLAGTGNQGFNQAGVPQQPVKQYTPPTNLKPTAIEQIAPYSEPEEVGKELKDKFMTDLDNAIQRDKQAMWNNVVEPLYEEKLAEQIEADSSDYDGGEISQYQEGDLTMDTPTPVIPRNIAPATGFNFDSDVTNEVAPKETVSLSTNQTFVEESIPAHVPTAPTTIPVEPVEDMDVSFLDEGSKVIEGTVAPSAIADLNLDDVFGESVNASLEEESEEDEMEAEVELSEEDKKEEIAEMQSVLRKHVNPINKIINLSEFTIASKPVSSSRVLSTISTSTQLHSANWVLPTAERSITMSELSGPEIEKLNPSMENSPLTPLMKNKELYGVFYNHILDENKPSSFDAWTKTVPFDDIAHLYFAAYRASFGHGSNMLPFQCSNPKCKHSFMEHKEISSMVKFKDNESKERAKVVMSKDPTTENYAITSKLFQVSDDICISFKMPSIYNAIFEDSILPEKFTRTYSDLLFYIQCIDDVYLIDHASKKLCKMVAKVEPTDIVKTTLNKYKGYASILQQLRSDEFYTIPAYIKQVRVNRSDEISFQLPEVKCPKCGHVIPATPIDAASLLFTRLRLQTILVL